jgi:hypothetical protein
LSRRAGAIPLTFLAGAIFIAACVDIPTGADDILSIQFDPLPSPSVVVGDSLRDTLGIVKPVSFKAFNFSGDEVSNPQVTFSTVDRGIRVDPARGFVLGDSVRSGARVFANVGGLTASVMISVSLRPDTIIGSNDRDSLSYLLTDTVNVSSPLGVRVLHIGTTDTSSVASYLVSFRILSPTDTAFAQLVTDAGTQSSLDTTDTGGVGARRIRINLKRIASLTDSVIVQALVKYRGVNVRGSPARLVLKVKPK